MLNQLISHMSEWLQELHQLHVVAFGSKFDNHFVSYFEIAATASIALWAAAFAVLTLLRFKSDRQSGAPSSLLRSYRIIESSINAWLIDQFSVVIGCLHVVLFVSLLLTVDSACGWILV